MWNLCPGTDSTYKRLGQPRFKIARSKTGKNAATVSLRVKAAYGTTRVASSSSAIRYVL